MEDMYHLFLEYARKRNFYSSQDIDLKQEAILCRTHVSNLYCSDIMQLIMLKKDAQQVQKSNVYIIHQGSYCALAHASAELLCESFTKLDLARFKYTFQYILNVEKADNFSLVNADNDNEYLDIARAVLQKKLSYARAQCFFLVWRAVAVLMDTVFQK